MTGLVFEPQAPPTVSAPNRVDVACFVGFVPRRPSTALPESLRRWLAHQGWARAYPGAGLPPQARPDAEVADLLDLPVPIESWDTFDRLYAWERRPLDGAGRTGSTYLGAAVRSFFAQGGRKCYVVRVGDPWPYTAGRDHRARQLSRLAPGFPTHTASTPVDRNTWRGVGHLFGLPDISFICLPDLCDAVRVEPVTEAPQVELPPPPEQFVECSDGEAPPPPDQTARLLVAPRSDEAGYDLWAQLLAWVARLLAQHRREVQLVAAVPLPHSPAGPSGAGAAPYRDLLEFLTRADVGPLAYRLGERTTGTASAFVQLVYPWIRTPGSTNLPEGLESPDAALTGILAQNALTRGTYRSVAGLPLGDIYEVLPVLRQDQMLRSWPDRPEATAASHNLMERVSLLGPTPGGLAVLSDVTATLGESYRPAGVNRLVASVLRAARRFGEDVVFESSGQRMWARLREQMVNLLLQLHRSGALRGATPAEAFSVRCDRTTMTQADIDAGRVIARIILNPASPIEQITVTLALEDGGLVSLASDQ